MKSAIFALVFSSTSAQFEETFKCKGEEEGEPDNTLDSYQKMKNQEISVVQADCYDFCESYFRDNTDGSPMCCMYAKGSAT